MTKQDQISHQRQIIRRVSDAIATYRAVLAGVLANRSAYVPGAADAHVAKFSQMIVQARGQVQRAQRALDLLQAEAVSVPGRGALQVRLAVVRRRNGSLAVTAPSGRGIEPGRDPSDDSRPAPLRFQTTTDLPARKGTTLSVRGMLRVVWDGDVARTVVVAQIDGQEIEVDLTPVW
jgi:hypothetical protein